jgi:hypothetical protein
VIGRRVAGTLAVLMIAAFGCSLAPAAASAELLDIATLTSGDQPADLLFVQNGMIEPIGFATIEASSQPDGTQPAGTWMVHLGGGFGPTWQGEVTCLSVAGNRAVIGLEGMTADAQGNPFRFVGFIGLVDGKENPGTGPVGPPPWPYPSVFNPPDHFEFNALPAGPAPVHCPSPADPLPGFQLWSLLASNVTVVDTPSKEQCKRGGWRALGFENQGQCVAAATRGPKP